MNSQKPIQIHISPSLSHLAISLPTFLSRNKQYTNLAVSSFIFRSYTPTTSAPHLLIVQRAASERSFPNLWEVPGGSCEASDPTILHSLARETFEETGLRLTKYIRQVGSGMDFVTGYGMRQKKWRKLSFEIEVAEIESDEIRGGQSGGYGQAGAKVDVGEDDLERVNGSGEDGRGGEVTVTLDPEEHQAYAWVTEKEIKDGKYSFMTTEQKDLMLESFTLRKTDEGDEKPMSNNATGAAP